MREQHCEICILGAGPAGLGAALALAEAGRTDVRVMEQHDRAGGLARTETVDGHRFDVGPHRFFTANQEIDALWHRMLGPDFRPVQRLTRIFYRERFYRYPVSAVDALPKMGPLQAAWALASYARAKISLRADRAETFADWVTAQFGAVLYERFFKTYTEKVWGIPCDQIGADWAAQRIKGLDLVEVIKNALGLAFSARPKTLVDEFDYPRLGAGMMYERMAERAAGAGLSFSFGHRVTGVERDDHGVRAVVAEGPDGPVRVTAGAFVNTLPLTRFLSMLTPAPDPDLAAACQALYYRDHITVNLAADGTDLFPDQWIYVHAPDVQMARLANYRNFSPDMAGSPAVSPISVEYFVFRSDPLWAMDDAALIDLAASEITRMGLVPRGAAGPGWVLRETDAYPTYFLGYEKPFARVRAAMDALANVQAAGRGGLYKYNNMDHSLYSGLLAARNLLAPGGPQADLWRINIDASYQEAAKRSP